MAAPLHLTELEEKLAAPGGEDLRIALAARAAALEASLAQRMAASAPRADFATLSLCRAAAGAARETLEQWTPTPEGVSPWRT